MRLASLARARSVRPRAKSKRRRGVIVSCTSLKGFNLKVDVKYEKMPPHTVADEKLSVALAGALWEVLQNDGVTMAHAARALELLVRGLGRFENFKDAYVAARHLTQVGLHTGNVKLTVDEVGDGRG